MDGAIVVLCVVCCCVGQGCTRPRVQLALWGAPTHDCRGGGCGKGKAQIKVSRDAVVASTCCCQSLTRQTMHRLTAKLDTYGMLIELVLSAAITP
jgi:hypothetical protein